MKRLSFFIGLILALCVLQLPAHAVRVNFELMPGMLSADDLTPDGRFLVGWMDGNGDGLPDGIYRFDRITDSEPIPLPAPGMSAVAISDDGSVVVGDIPDPSGVGTNVAGRWTEATGWESLGHLPNAGACPSRSDSYEVSADGRTVVGLSWDGCSGRGFVWTQDTGMLELENLANGNNRASVVSGDGSIIGGFAQGSFSRTPAVWRSDTTGQLLDPPNGDSLGEVHGIRDDGSILLGTSSVDTASTPQATKWRWNQATSSWEKEIVEGGSFLPGWEGIPTDIADDDTLVGFDILLGNRRGWIQPQGEGPLTNLRTYFEDNGATIPQGLVLEVPQAISTDGRVIVGHGFGTGAWIATLFDDCDFDSDLDCDIADVDELISAIVTQSADPLFDLTGDGNLDLADRDAWLDQAGAINLASGAAYLIGDSNLDGAVDVTDFLKWNANKFGPTGTWSTGDWNADGVTDVQDFLLWNMNKFQSADLSVVPEPTGIMRLLLTVGIIAPMWRKKR